MTKEITIKEGWYWSVGTNYWDCKENSREGIGLNRDLFDSEKILVTVKGHKYELDSKTGLDFIREHKSFKNIGTVKVGFVPRSLMKEL
jgi:mRNA-degrading endonuclease HigB of HigAB toxin-antitoxin module